MQTVDDRTFEEKFQSFKFECERKKEAVVSWCKEHKELCIAMAPIVVTGVFDVIKEISRTARQHEEKVLKENYIYDRRRGHYVQTRRPLKPKEWRIFDERYQMGESVSDIVNDLRLNAR